MLCVMSQQRSYQSLRNQSLMNNGSLLSGLALTTYQPQNYHTCYKEDNCATTTTSSTVECVSYLDSSRHMSCLSAVTTGDTTTQCCCCWWCCCKAVSSVLPLSSTSPDHIHAQNCLVRLWTTWPQSNSKVATFSWKEMLEAKTGRCKRKSCQI